jgi:hypothetical protein
MSSGLYKAVCYRCSYEGAVPEGRCPVCQFPMIFEPEGTPPRGRSLEEVFARDSLREGAPPLPGVHAEKRKAQLLAEARRERRATQRTRKLDLPLPAPSAGAAAVDSFDLDLASVKIPRFRRSPLVVALFCASAVAAGAIAAAFQSGAL